MKVALTGGVGFVGSHVADVLREQSHQVTIFDRRAELPVELSSASLDFTGFDAVIHCAAHADISRNWASRAERSDLYRDNVTALINVLEATPATAQFTFVSSAAVGQSDSPYAATKVFGEALARAYLGRSAKVVRLVSCVGPRYTHGHIHDFVHIASRGDEIVARDDGRRPKSHVHVRDAAEAIATWGTDGEYRPSAVVCAAGQWSWRDTAAMMGVRPRWLEDVRGWRGDPVGLRVDSDWICSRSVGEGVREALTGLGWPLPAGPQNK